MVVWTDEFGRWHDKPTNGERPSSNNGYIYTAYAKNLELTIDLTSIRHCFQNSVLDIGSVKFTRHPAKWLTSDTPPPSRDEVLGLISLGLLDVTYLKKNEWCFEIRGKKIDRLDWFKVILEMLQLSQEHRNEVWRGNYPNASQLAFRLGFHDIFYAKAMIGIPTSVEEEMIWSYYVDDMKHSRDWSAKNVCIMQMEDLELDISKMSKKNSYKKYFKEGHPFVKS